LDEEAKGFARGMVDGEGSDDDVVGGGVGVRGGVEDGEGVVEGVREEDGGRFEEVFGDRGAEDEAGFDEVGVDLVLVPAVLALFKDY
jgi:hypothetical protein